MEVDRPRAVRRPAVELVVDHQIPTRGLQRTPDPLGLYAAVVTSHASATRA
jgi:hypothetical protein